MQIGVVFPQTEFGSDAAAIRDYAQSVEGLGFSHVLAYDHVLGARPRPGWDGPYTYQDTFHEPFVLFAFMAAVTSRLGFATGVLILPQRQTALVAKQAAELDILCGGRLRLGVGLGWNPVEYTALGQDFGQRGRRMDEQVTLLRRLWCEPLVTFEGRWDQVPDAGIAPLPVQRPIPIWMGSYAERALRRTAQLADGWMPGFRLPIQAAPALEILWRELEAAGRSRQDFGIEVRFPYNTAELGNYGALMADWQAVGATHFSFNTMGCGFGAPAEHLQALQTLARVLEL